MISIERNIKIKKKLKKKVIIFDLDGVLIDSKSNMKKAWGDVQKKLNLHKIKFCQI